MENKALNQTEVSMLFAAARHETELRWLRESNLALNETLRQTRLALSSANAVSIY